MHLLFISQDSQQLYLCCHSKGAPSGQHQPQQLPNANSVQRHEVDSILNSHRELATNIRDVRQVLKHSHHLTSIFFHVLSSIFIIYKYVLLYYVPLVVVLN